MKRFIKRMREALLGNIKARNFIISFGVILLFCGALSGSSEVYGIIFAFVAIFSNVLILVVVFIRFIRSKT